jgi:phage terminase large subunit-like protein
MSNVVSKTDRKDNEYPNKDKPENKIDGPVAMMMAMNRAMNHVYMDIDDFINNMVSIDQ